MIDAGVADPEHASPLDAFLAHASLEAGDNQAGAGQDALQLMTVHSAKGLEFDAVFIGGLEEGLFPHDNSTTELAGLEEERRLMYVAITRAPKAPLPVVLADADAARADALQPEVALLRRAARGVAEVADAAQAAAATGGYGGRRRQQHLRSLQRGVGRRRAARRPDRAAPAWADQQRGGESKFRIGQTVVHAKFGEGVIVNLEGGGNDARAQINFGRQGMKWLALGIAKLGPA